MAQELDAVLIGAGVSGMDIGALLTKAPQVMRRG